MHTDSSGTLSRAEEKRLFGGGDFTEKSVNSLPSNKKTNAAF